MTKTTLRFMDSKLSAGATDVLVIGVTQQNGKLAILASSFTPAQDKKISDALLAVGATGKPGELTRIPSNGLVKSESILAVGLKEDANTETIRQSAGTAIRTLAGTKKVSIQLRDMNSQDAAATAEGALIAAYGFHSFRYSSLAEQKLPPTAISVLSKHATRTMASEISTVVGAIHFARDLGNTPPGHLPPAEFVNQAKKAIASAPITATVWDEKKLVSEKFGGIIGVGQGSSRPPRLLKLEYKPRGAKKHLALIGKGITFDTGGISLKPGLNMHDMKFDMRPGDVLRIYGGKTVEVLNTDAEGRLVLADALVKASEEKPDYIVDLATLTGAQVMGMGLRTAGIMGNNDEFRSFVHHSAEATGEDMWPMPLPEFLRAEINSPVADLANIGSGKGAGMQLAAVFLREFVPAEIPWAHLDIAGPAYNQGSAYGYNVVGSTGFGIRTLVEVAKRVSVS